MSSETGTSIIALRKAIRADLFDLSDFQWFVSLSIEHASVSNLTFASDHSAITSAEASNSGSTWLAHNTSAYRAIMSIQARRSQSRWQIWDRGHSAKCATIGEERAKACRYSTRRSNGRVTFTYIPVGRTRGESRGLLMQCLHVRHRFLDAKSATGRCRSADR